MKVNMDFYKGFLTDDGENGEISKACEALDSFLEGRNYTATSNIIDAVTLALANIVKCNIRVHYRKTNGTFDSHIFQCTSNSDTSIELAYVANNHYDLVVTKTDFQLSPFKPIVSRPESPMYESTPKKSRIDSTSEDSDDDSDSDLLVDRCGNRTLSAEVREKMSLTKVEHVPNDIDGNCGYWVTGENRHQLLDKCKDGRTWIYPDSQTKWNDYDTVRYKNCKGSLICTNIDCWFLKSYQRENQLKFDKNNCCSFCLATAKQVLCKARKYIATRELSAHIYHFGKHSCQAKVVVKRQSDLVSQALNANPNVKPSVIQSSAILSAMRSRSSFSDVRTIVSKVADKKSISNEKIKQKKKQNPGTAYDAVRSFKKYTDTEDKFFVYLIDEGRQIVFKTSSANMKMAYEMTSSGALLSKEYCFFDGKVKRTAGFTTLTASLYHVLLQKQLPLAIMECISEDSENISFFWEIFNRAFKEANNVIINFKPVGWVTDMGLANFVGLRAIYGSDVDGLIKGCEFHYRKSYNEKASTLDEALSTKFIGMANQLLESETKEGYMSTYITLSAFISSHCPQLESWLTWWHVQREMIFRAFKPINQPRMNQAEVIHASWKLRDDVGLTLIESTEADVRDFMLNEQYMEQSSTGTTPGRGIAMGERDRRENQREIDAARRRGEELVQFGVDSSEQTFSSPTVSSAKKTPLKTIVRMFDDRRETVSRMDWKLKSVKKLSESSKAFNVLTAQRSFSTVTLCQTPSCNCANFKKYNDKVLCKHILFVVLEVFGAEELIPQLRNRYIGVEDVTSLLSKKIPDQYMATATKQTTMMTAEEYASILGSHPFYNNEQV
jgi:hypothetical protein